MRAVTLVLASLTLSFAACGEPPPAPTHTVTFITTSDGYPLPDVAIKLGEQLLGKSGERGEITTTLRGRDGTTLDYRAECPPGYREPRSTPQLVLRSFRAIGDAGAGRGIEVRLDCPPSERRVAVVIKATNGADVPVLFQGREVARTDAQGFAHVFVRSSPSTSFRLVLDTREKPLLRPSSPTHEFRVDDSDDYFLLEQPFVVEVPPPKKIRRPRRPVEPPRLIPVKIPSRRR